MNLTVLNQIGPPAHELLAHVPGVDVIDLDPSESPDPELRAEVLATIPRDGPAIDALERLGVRWVHFVGTGIDSIPLDRLGERLATCSRGASEVPISEFVLAVMLAFEKRIPEIWQAEKVRSKQAQSRRAEAPRFDLGGLAGRTLALVGLGAIGTSVARKALAFDMVVVGLRRRPDHGVPLAGVHMASDLTSLLERADHIVLAAPLTRSTYHLFDAAALQLVKPGAHLVNVSRGGLIDHDALQVALDDGRIARATLDVVEPEPLPPDHWLRTHHQVRLSAHISWSSPRGMRTNIEVLVENLHRYLRNEPLLGVIDRLEGY